jgi:hypothetical protein
MMASKDAASLIAAPRLVGRTFLIDACWRKPEAVTGRLVEGAAPAGGSSPQELTGAGSCIHFKMYIYLQEKINGGLIG